MMPQEEMDRRIAAGQCMVEACDDDSVWVLRIDFNTSHPIEDPFIIIRQVQMCPGHKKVAMAKKILGNDYLQQMADHVVTMGYRKPRLKKTKFSFLPRLEIDWDRVPKLPPPGGLN